MNVSRSYVYESTIDGTATVEDSFLSGGSVVKGDAKVRNVRGRSVTIEGHAVVENVTLPDHAVIGEWGHVTSSDHVHVLPTSVEGEFVTVYRDSQSKVRFHGNLATVDADLLDEAMGRVLR